MSPESLEIAKTEYQAGKAAFEGGQYRQSVEHLQKASALVARNSGLGGEIQMWLVTAYEAAGQRSEAIALCQELQQHPSLATRQQSRRLLYILEAPQLSRRPEWLTQIPDLASLNDNETKTRLGGVAPSVKNSPSPLLRSEPVDLTEVNTKDNRFIWFALFAVSLIVGGLLWLS